jgi:hypothetical protein
MNQDLLAALAPVVAALEALGVSVASSAHGIPRTTIDADVVAELPASRVDSLVARLADTYYIDRDAALDAVARRAMFNVIHLATMIKVDIYVLTTREFDRLSFERRRPGAIPDSDREFLLDTPEDTILHKLEWFRAGGDVSDRQWHDIVGVLQVQGDALDTAYLDTWAERLGVSDLLRRARAEANR